MPQKALGSIVGLLYTGTCLVQGKEFCLAVNGEQYRCEMGYCCGERECCTYYYELWWFWLVWTLIIMLSCCCAYRHRRVKMRLQQEQRQREISLMAYQGASSSFISPPPLNLRFWNDCKLPDYEEVVGHPPTPPPPYSENPPEATPTPALPPQLLREPDATATVPQPLTNTDPTAVDSQATASSSSSSSAQEAQCLAEGQCHAGAPLMAANKDEDDDEEEDDEFITRRRHVTGDSGIEVCVCQMDVDEGSGLEEEEEESDEEQQQRITCKVTGRDCCSGHHHRHHHQQQQQQQQQAFRHKEHQPGQTASTSTGDHMV